MMVRVKLCGLSRLADVEAVNELLPEYVGFVFWAKSRRYVTPEAAALLRSSLHPDIEAVGVFVDEDVDEAAHIVESVGLGLVQLHGHESPEYISRLRKAVSVPVIKAFKVRSVNDVDEARRCQADYVMLDSGMGTGKVFSWELVKNVGRDYFLAGGLTPENVGEAVNSLKPFAVDVSSGIETDGTKDALKMKEFVRAVREGGQND